MTINRDAVAAFVLLVGFLAMGLGVTSIELFPGQETEVFSPRTMPAALAVGGALLCLLRVVQCLQHPDEDAVALGGFDWTRATLLCVVMIGYGLLFEPLGFVLATTLFLVAGFVILGERRVVVLALLPLLFTLLFWLVMTRLLGMYLAPGFFGA